MAGNGEFARILDQNERFSEAFDRSVLTAAPLTGLAILTCMDARIDVEDALGLRVGDAHIIRNAAGLASQDAIRSLVVSQQLLGTREIVVIAHTRCGLHGADEAALRGTRPGHDGPGNGDGLRRVRRPRRQWFASRWRSCSTSRRSWTSRSTAWSTTSRPAGFGRSRERADTPGGRQLSGRRHRVRRPPVRARRARGPRG